MRRRRLSERQSLQLERTGTTTKTEVEVELVVEKAEEEEEEVEAKHGEVPQQAVAVAVEGTQGRGEVPKRSARCGFKVHQVQDLMHFSYIE